MRKLVNRQNTTDEVLICQITDGKLIKYLNVFGEVLVINKKLAVDMKNNNFHNHNYIN